MKDVQVDALNEVVNAWEEFKEKERARDKAVAELMEATEVLERAKQSLCDNGLASCKQKHYHVKDRWAPGGRSVVVVVSTKLKDGGLELGVIKPIEAEKARSVRT